MEMGPKNCRCKAYQDNKINALLMTSYTGGISAWMIIEHDALCLYLVSSLPPRTNNFYVYCDKFGRYRVAIYFTKITRKKTRRKEI